MSEWLLSYSVQQFVKSFSFVSCFYMHLLEAYTNVDSHYIKQLTHLLAAAHLVLDLLRQGERSCNDFSKLLLDLMATIKNAYVLCG